LSPVLTLRAAGTRTPLFCLPPGLGIGWSYAALLPHLAGRPVHALQPDALGRVGRLPDSIGEVAAEYAARIRSVQPEGPYLLLGWSFGGLLCYETAAQLQAAGQPVGLAAVLDTIPGDGSPLDRAEVEELALRILLRQGAPGEPGRAEPADLAAAVEFVRSADGPLRGASAAQVRYIFDLAVRYIELAQRYRPPRFEGQVVLFSAAEETGASAAAFKAGVWRRTAANVEVHELDAVHRELMDPPAAAAIGRALAPTLREF
jgi:thioesterase domain-containing protein